MCTVTNVSTTAVVKKSQETATRYSSSKPLKSDVVRGREIHSHLIAIKNLKVEWDSLWVWQCWQKRVISHLKREDRKTFLSLKSTGQIGSLACLAACLASELE